MYSLSLDNLLTNDPTIEHFRIHHTCIISDEVVKKLLNALRTNTQLKILKLEYCYQSLNAINIIINALQNDNTIEQLLLIGTKLTNFEVIALANVLKVNTTLKIVDISSNHINHVGSIAIANALKINTTLIKLNMNFNSICDYIPRYRTNYNNGAIIEFINMLKINRSLQTFHIFGCYINNGDVIEIIKTLFYNTSLLDFGTSFVDDNDVIKEIVNLIKINHTLKRLNISPRVAWYGFVKQIQDAIQYNYTLEFMNNCKVGTFSEENRNIRRRFLTSKSARR